MRRIPWILILSLVLGCGTARDEGNSIPALFGNETISSPLEEYRLSFAPDGRTIYFARSRALFSSSRASTIMMSRWLNDGWSAPEIASFSGTWADIDPFVTRDGTRIYFSSIRPVDGMPRTDSEIWYVEREGAGWSEPVHVESVSTPYDELYPSVGLDGILYFGSNRPDGRGGWDIWKAEPEGNGWKRPVNLENLNSSQSEFNPAVSPDGRHLVFTAIGRTENIGMGDLFVSWKNGPGWSVPVHLNPWVNSPADDYHPSFSIDGQILYFVRREHPARGGDIYAVPWSFVEP